MMKLVQHNMQLHFLNSGWHADAFNNRRDRYDPFRARQEQEDTWESMLQHLDWVGTLEAYNETLSVLGRITGKPDLVDSWEKHNEKKIGVLSPSKLASDSVETIKELSSFDRELYERVRQTYTLEKAFA